MSERFDDSRNLSRQAAEAQASSDRGDGAIDWFRDNVIAPAYDAGIVQPYNAIANVVNSPVQAIGQEAALPKLKPMELAPAAMLSPEWAAQNISAGLAMAVVFTGIGRVTRTIGSAALGANLTPSASMIIGGTAFEGIRDLRPGETRLGNMLGGATMLATFEAGNHLSRSLTGSNLAAARLWTGATAAAGHSMVGSMVSRGELPTTRQLGDAMLTGATMNLALPVLQEKMFGSSGKPVPESRKIQPDLTRAEGVPRVVSEATVVAETSAAAEIPTISKVGTEKVLFVEGLSEPRRFANFTDYYEHGRVFSRKEMDVYRAPDQLDTEILVPASRPPELTPQQATGILREVPDPRLVRRLILQNASHADEPWLRQQYGNEYRILGEAFEVGDIHLFQPRAGNARETLMHEWAHLFKLKAGRASSVFDRVGELEPFADAQPGIASNSGEMWSLLSEGLLSTNPSRVMLTAHQYPIRSAIYGRALAETLSTIPASRQSVHHERYQGLTEYLRESIQPIAQERLGGALNQPNVGADAIATLDFLAGG